MVVDLGSVILCVYLYVCVCVYAAMHIYASTAVLHVLALDLAAGLLV